MLTSLATDTADPVARLRRVGAAMSEAKFQESLIGVGLLTDWTEFTFPALIGGAAHMISAMRLFDHVRRHSTSRSRISRTSVPLFLAGARVVACIPSGQWSKVQA